MLLNYIKTAYRIFVRHKAYAIIDIMGLAVGIACSILLLLFVANELSYNKYNSKYNRIYLIQSHLKLGDRERYSPTFPSLSIGQVLEDQFPSVEESARIYNPESTFYFIDQHKEVIGENNIWYADPEIFNVFDHQFIYGKPETALNARNTIAISESFAKKYFGEKNPVGDALSLKDGTQYLVKGVFKDIPQNSSCRYDALMPVSEVIKAPKFKEIGKNVTVASMSMIDAFTYILLSKKAKISDLADNYERFKDELLVKSGLQPGMPFEPIFQPLSRVYLDSRPWPNSPINVLQQVYIMSGIALLVLAIACINYMNHATAKSSTRIMEVGVRKVLGADRSALIRQFLCEAFITTLAAMVIALVLVELLLPGFNSLVGKKLFLDVNMELVSGMLLLILLVGLIAGGYPAFFLSSFLPATVLRENPQALTGKGRIRKILVVLQYAISVTIITCTIVLITQMNYIRQKDLGFNKENVYVITPNMRETNLQTQVFKESLLNYSGILAAGESSATAGGMGSSTGGNFEIEDSSGKLIENTIRYLVVDYDFINLMDMKILSGRSFDEKTKTDQTGVLINEALVKEMGWTDSPIGKRIQFVGEFKVLGVLKDFHFGSLHTDVKPLVVMLKGGTGLDILDVPTIVSIKIHPENTENTLEFVRKKWLETNPAHPAEISSIEDIIGSQYRTEEAATRIFIYSAFIGIFVSCLGLFGLSSFVVESKTKEIGIRKVFGASITGIVYRQTFDFVKLAFISTVIAWPIAYYAMDRWLENFAFRIKMHWWLFALSAGIAMAIALLTVSFHTVRASLINPVKALRYK